MDAAKHVTCITCSVDKERSCFYESRLKRSSYICKKCSTTLRGSARKASLPSNRLAARLRDRKTPLPVKVLRVLLNAYAAASEENKIAVDADKVDVVARGGGMLTEHNAEVVRRERRR